MACFCEASGGLATEEDCNGLAAATACFCMTAEGCGCGGVLASAAEGCGSGGFVAMVDEDGCGLICFCAEADEVVVGALAGIDGGGGGGIVDL